MRIAALVSLFDGEELLKGALSQIRDEVDTIIVSYQTISYFGEVHFGAQDTVLDLLEEGLIDKAFLFEPRLGVPPRWNELEKRRRLFAACKDEHSHFLFLDADEYYETYQFREAKTVVDSGGYDSSFCQMYTYYKEPVFRWTPIEGYVVPFLHKVKADTVIGRNDYGSVDPTYPASADPTRITKEIGKHIDFSTSQLMMHHFSFVRKDIGRKLRNSSAKNDFGRHEKSIDRLVWEFHQFDPQRPKYIVGERTAVEIVDDIFGVGKIDSL